AQAHAQRARERRLDLPGVGTRVLRAVAAPGREGPARRAADEHGDRSRDARDRPVQGIVEPGGGPAELAVAVALVADPRVERVRGAVGAAARRARDPAPEQRADDGVARVLGNRLDGRPDEPGLVELLGVAAAEPGQQLAGALDVVVLELRCEL